MNEIVTAIISGATSGLAAGLAGGSLAARMTLRARVNSDNLHIKDSSQTATGQGAAQQANVRRGAISSQSVTHVAAAGPKPAELSYLVASSGSSTSGDYQQQLVIENVGETAAEDLRISFPLDSEFVTTPDSRDIPSRLPLGQTLRLSCSTVGRGTVKIDVQFTSSGELVRLLGILVPHG